MFFRIPKQNLMDVLNAIRIGNAPNPIMKYSTEQMVTMTFCGAERLISIKTIDMESKIMIHANLASGSFHDMEFSGENVKKPVSFTVYLEELFEIARDAEKEIDVRIPDERNGEMVIFTYGKNTSRFYGYKKMAAFPEYEKTHSAKQVVVAAQDVIEMCKERGGNAQKPAGPLTCATNPSGSQRPCPRGEHPTGEGDRPLAGVGGPIVLRLENGTAIFEKNNVPVLSCHRPLGVTATPSI